SETTTPWEQYKDNIAEVSLSDEITHVGNFAFCRMWGVSWLNLPGGLTSVGAYAFYNCTFPRELHLPEGLYHVGSFGLCAFNGVKDLYVPKSLGVVEDSGLTDFMGLENFHVDPASPYFTDKGNSIIEKATNMMISGCKNTVIPEGVKVIGPRAFEDVRMESIKFPKSLITIDANAFTCSSLKEVNIPDNVQAIETSAFSQCGQMTKATIGRGVTSIGQTPFYGCTNLFDVYCHADPKVLNWKSTTYEDKSFMPDTVTVMHVKSEDVALWESKFNFLNLRFKGDLNGHVETILDETKVEVSDLKGADLTDNTVGNVYYNLSDATGSGYKDGGYLVIGKTTDISQIGTGEPGSADVRDNFTGIILKVGPGKGTITIDARVVDKGWKTQLAVRIGNGTPTYAARDSRWDVIVGYNVDVETYVYIYAVGNGALVRSFGNMAPEDDDEEGLYIYGITVTPDDETGINAVNSDKIQGSDVWYDLNGRMMLRKPTEKGIYIRNGKKILVK
ncbi:MAG: leucine-rich repeat domain-containing protein, partial [Bacteroidaceae bacterium]|nr:leucine-rich repeat domain-containing protein [Bacteroidaceae bacterium]